MLYVQAEVNKMPIKAVSLQRLLWLTRRGADFSSCRAQFVDSGAQATISALSRVKIVFLFLSTSN